MKILILLLFYSTSTLAFDQTHKVFDHLLSKYVHSQKNQSWVDYAGLKKAEYKLDAYLRELAGIKMKTFKSFSKDDQLAFLINAYNAYTLKLILNHYPVKSIKDIGSLFSSAWKKPFFKLLGKERHLDDIEHGMIRKDFQEPRIHFAINCASIGCPSLYRETFVGKKLDLQLENATKWFLGNKQKNRLDIAKKTLFLSKLFKWYAEDFEKKSGSVAKYLASYFTDDPKIREALEAGKYELVYLDYDWKLNDYAKVK